MTAPGARVRAPRPARAAAPLLVGAALAGALLAGCAPTPAVEPVPVRPVCGDCGTAAGSAADTLGPLAAAPMDAPLPSDTTVRSGTLPNGLRYFVRRNARPERRAELRLVVDAGSVLERDDERGLAHFVEHMAFNGTRRFERQELVHYLESVGMRFGADLNAYTSFDETVYQLTLPTDTAGVLDRGLEILGEWAHAVTFDSAEVERERPVVIEEWRLGQGAEARLRDQQMPLIFRGSLYADRLPIGDTSVVRRARVGDLRAFYERWYRPDLMAVVAVGDFDPAEVERGIRAHFGPIRGAVDVTPRPTPTVPGHAETLVGIATDDEATATSVSVLYKRDPEPARQVGDYRRQLVESLYDAMLNARLYEIAQRPDAPFLGAGSSKGRFLRARDAYSLGAAVDDTSVVRGLEALLTEAARVDRHGFTDTELDRARQDLLRRMEIAFAEREKTMSAAHAGRYVDAFLYDEPYLSTDAAWALHRRFVPEITLDEVNSLARSYIGDSNRVVLVTAPSRADVRLPDEAELLATFARVEAARVTAYEDDVNDAALVPEPPAAGRVVESRLHDEVGVTEWTLSNGVRVLVKPTTFRDDQVLLSATSPGGTSLAPDDALLSASVAATVAALGGAGEFDQVQLDKRLAGKAASASPRIGLLDEGISGSASPRDLETLFQLVHLYVTAPREDTAAFRAFQARARSVLENRGRDPESALADTLQVTLADGHPRARPLTLERLDELDLGTAMRFYRDRFADAGDFTFAIVGTVDTASLRPLVERWLGGLPSAGRRESWRDPGVRAPEGVVRRTVRRGVEPRSSTRMVFHGPAEFGMARRFEIAALAQVLDMRLRDALREDMGGTYGASVSGYLGREPRPEYSVSVSFGSSPERQEELAAAVLAEIGRLRRDGPTAEEMTTVREMLRRSMETGMEQNAYWLGQLLTYDRLALPLAGILHERPYVEALTPEVVRLAADRYLDPSRYVQVVLLPEAAAAPAAPGGS